ncbi:MAG: Ldh family oxidoreductase [Caldilineaceae bacterium]|nr:Ldh family oxidoreductase [Caldilineaceae bacterium]MCY4116527.1 Ldh family oxidoreductase [Caldilineaceae bacterium]MDE0069722.1 Ldh family oxidoreductase [Caldilineaceae bacterium]MDE0181717.1 Ldh family oxidoreductase [Caldilineaceae bacterium]
MTQSNRHSASYLRRISRNLFAAAGTPEDIAATVADILVNANLAGHDSHGVQFVPMYLDRIEAGELKPAARPEIVRETSTTVHVDGHYGFGHNMSRQAMDWAIERARRTAVCCVTFENSTHIGRLGEYAEQAARAGCVTVITLGWASDGPSQVVPFGGARGCLGTNPMAVGIPTGDDAPFVIDFATSVIAGGKILVARDKGVDLPPGAVVDKDGRPSTDPGVYFDGGSLLPFGGHKGYALSLYFSLMGGLAGGFAGEHSAMSGLFMQVYDVAGFSPLDEYQRQVRIVLDAIKATPPAPGFDEVLVPGDFEHRSRQQRLAEGIEVPAETYGKIEVWAEKLDISLDREAGEE